MNHGSLFSGIGGFDLAAEWMGWNNIFHCENNKFCQKILHKHFPNSIQHGDIKTTDFANYRGRIDIITGGFPCQPFSVAGKRKGTEDDRYLWPEMLRAIREIKPTWVIGENVYGIINWNGGMVLNTIKADLENEGYEIFKPFILPACGVNAPHRRNRAWIIGYSSTNSNSNKQSKIKGNIKEVCGFQIEKCESENSSALSGRNFNENVTNSNHERLQGGKINGSINEVREIRNEQFAGCVPPDWSQFPTQSPLCGRNDGIPNRVDRLKSLGNAIVPQVAYEIFKAIEQVENAINQ